MRIFSRFKKPRVARMLGGALGLLLALSLVLVPANPVSALPQLSHRFQGSVTINEEPAPGGVQVSATIADVDEVFTATTDAEGKYHLLYVKADDPDTPEKEGGVNGDEINFYVADDYATSYPFKSGDSTTLDLTVGQAVIPGDANGDGVINVLDVTKVVRIVLALDAETPGADANEDGVVNVLDITKIVRIILGLD